MVPYNFLHRNHPLLVHFHAWGIAKLDSWGYGDMESGLNAGVLTTTYHSLKLCHQLVGTEKFVQQKFLPPGCLTIKRSQILGGQKYILVPNLFVWGVVFAPSLAPKFCAYGIFG